MSEDATADLAAALYRAFMANSKLGDNQYVDDRSEGRAPYSAVILDGWFDLNEIAATLSNERKPE